VAPPFRTAEFDIMNIGGISRSGGILEAGIEMGIIQKQGAFLKYGEKLLGQGREAAKLYLEENPKLANEITKKIWEQVKSGKKVVPKEIGEESSEEE